MKTDVIIKGRNPEWYWPKERMTDSKNKDSMSRKEWEMLNEDKIPRHLEEVDFTFTFDVKSFKEKRNSNFPMSVYVSESADFISYSVHNVIFKNVTVVGFLGDKTESYVIVSDELIHQFISAKKGAKGKQYWYFYLKENADFVHLAENVWLSRTEYENIRNQVGRFAVERDPYMKRKKLSGSFAASLLNSSVTDF